MSEQAGEHGTAPAYISLCLAVWTGMGLLAKACPHQYPAMHRHPPPPSHPYLPGRQHVQQDAHVLRAGRSSADASAVRLSPGPPRLHWLSTLCSACMGASPQAHPRPPSSPSPQTE